MRFLLALLTALSSLTPAFAADPRHNPGQRGDAPRRDAPRREAPRVPQTPREMPRREQPREQPRREVPRQQPPRQDPPRREIPRQDPPRRHDPRRRGPVIRPNPEQPRQPGQPQNPGGVRRRLPRPERITDRTRVIDIDRTQIIRYPSVDGSGRRLGHTHLGRAPYRSEHTTIINNNITIVNDYARRYTTRGVWWWHDHNGYRLGHHCDARGRHWFGWYIGTVYFWTVWHGDYYWHWDPYYERWVYWHQNRRWYEHPTTRVIYIYDDRRYYRYEDVGGGVVTRPDTTPPVAQPPAEPGDADPADESYFSEDGTREVRVYGDERDAFLYDTAETPSFEPKWLASGVKEVQFSDTSDGTPLQINIVTEKKKTENGVETVVRSFKLFDANGERLGLPEPAPGETPEAAKTGAYKELESGTPGWD